MLRTPAKTFGSTLLLSWKRSSSSSNHIRKTFIEYFRDRHKHVIIKSSPVVPLCDPTVPFVNAGMNQFKGVFLGTIEPPAPRVVNSQKCIRVGGKHNDLSVVGTDGYHHTFFEMLGNWSFGDYYKEEACQMAWTLMCQEFKVDPSRLRVTYFQGDAELGIPEDAETKDIWRRLGVPEEQIWPHGVADNFWEMGQTGPCGPCTEIHYVNDDGSLTELWNIVFIQFNREADGKISLLPKRHVDTGMGLERMARLLQQKPSNFHTDLFVPIISAIHERSNGGVPEFAGRYGSQAALDVAYRRLADHARMISVCLADCTVPAANLNLKQIMRIAFKISTDVFKCPQGTMLYLYDVVAETLGTAYPELLTKEKDAKLILQQEEASYVKLRKDLAGKWKGLVEIYPEVAELSDVELPGFALGYKVFKETMCQKSNNTVPGELMFRLYDTHGFPEDLIHRVAKLNNYDLDNDIFRELLAQHKNRHKASFREQSENKGLLFNEAIEELNRKGILKTNDEHKYDFAIKNNTFPPLNTKLVALLDSKGNLLKELSNLSEKDPYYIVTESTNFFCEEGGQICDSGVIKINDNLTFDVDSVFKIRDFVFHKGSFKDDDAAIHTVNAGCNVLLNINGNKRLEIMKNHTSTHIINAALRLMLPNSVVYQCGSKVTDKGHMLSLSVYGEKISHDSLMKTQQLVKNTISSNRPVQTRTLNSVQLSLETGVTTVPGEVYPERGLRLLQLCHDQLVSKELCCGTHVPSTAYIQDFFITNVKGINSNTPAIYALAGDSAIKARRLFAQTETLTSFKGLVDKEELKQEVAAIRQALTDLCGAAGKPTCNYAEALKQLDTLTKVDTRNDVEAKSLEAIALEEVAQATKETDSKGRPYTVHFLRCSYLMSGGGVGRMLRPHSKPVMLIACASGTLGLACRVPQDMVTETFSAAKWLSVVLPVFNSKMKPAIGVLSPDVFAEMEGTKVSLINCEQLVSDAMRAAIRYANSHAHSRRQLDGRDTTIQEHDDDKNVGEDQVFRLFSNKYKKGSN